MSAIRHTSETVRQVREMAAAGKSHRTIVRVMAARGTPVSASTVARWLSPRARARQNRATSLHASRKRALRSKGRIPGRLPGLPWRMERARQLRRLGLTNAQVAAVLSWDLRIPVTEREIEHALNTTVPPAGWLEVAA